MAAGRFMVVAITTREARVWDMGVGPGSVPHVILSDDPHREQRHVRPSQDDHMHHRRIDDPSFYAAVARAVSGASEVLLVGHGKGKANAMLSFVQYLERKEPAVARLVTGAMSSNLEAMTDGEILAAAREWWTQHVAVT
ncbi:MAG: hypothetical protein ACKO1X_08480 [Acidimicrobiales bacterium]